MLVAAAFAPAKKEIIRTIEIEAPAKDVYLQVANFKKWEKWDPWMAKDTTQQRNYKGAFGSEDHSYSWVSDNKDVGTGHIEAAGSTPYSKFSYRLFFDEMKPADGYFSIVEEGTTTTVSWVMISEHSYPIKFLNYFMESMIAPDFEAGLKNLKEYLENEVQPQDNDVDGVQIATEYGVNYAMIKEKVLPMAAMDSFFGSAYKKLYRFIQTNGLAAKGTPKGFYYVWDEANGTTDLAVAVPISESLTEQYSEIEIETGKAKLANDHIVTRADGGYSSSYKAHMALERWVEENRKSIKMPVVEEYLVGPKETADTNAYRTQISYYFD